MSTDTTGHSDYWNYGSQSMQNQAAVVAGQYGKVKHEEWLSHDLGRPPEPFSRRAATGSGDCNDRVFDHD